ncbi:Clavaminate synthase-like protein [Daedalea quercina L-15889]|uniref:JmjC domain-containing histone demethylation protein 1 n=1 Tax=Daedalea quercina L-15889 TaxID=1314783 RepID=A0A165NE00_9APHY|nr:Clavaminate synthase-like protein [Daedalea quercina L-15889]
MARARRRNGKKSPEGAEEPEEGSVDVTGEGAAQAQASDDTCPACAGGSTEQWAAADKENWVRCDACKTWYHWRCAGDGGDLDAIDKWFCKACMAQDPARTITMKPPARKSARKKTQRDYAGLHSVGAEGGPGKWLRILEGKKISGDPFRRMKGSEVGEEWLESDEGAMREPVVIESPDGLGMKMPPKSFTVGEVAEVIGEDFPVEVIDVATQSNVPGWTLGKWAEYYAQEPSARDKVRNVISLEISGTELADRVLPPRLVRELDWVEKFWPSTKKGRGNAYPKVQLYCLMGVAGAWTDWHVDFAGSSVYYHILHGTKVFYFIRPTPANLQAYERWSGTEMQNLSWLGDLCDEVFRVELHDGNTMIIPTGWIHAVYTPEDTLVFGGNFLHSYNVPVQLKVREIEINTHVPKKFRFPHFVKLCWYAAEKYLRDLKSKEEFSPRILESVEALADFLVAEARAIERGTDHAKREAKEQVPSDRVKDAPALARELRWRVRLTRGESSDDEGRGHRKSLKANGSVESLSNGAGTKRKRSPAPGDAGIFRNFKPRLWERVANQPVERDSRVVKVRRPAPDGDDWNTRWAEWKDGGDAETGEGAEAVRVERRKDVIVKVRRTEKGIERQRVERILEEWVWPGGSREDQADARPTVEPVKEDGDVDMKDLSTVAAADGGGTSKVEEGSPETSGLNGHAMDVVSSGDTVPQPEAQAAAA